MKRLLVTWLPALIVLAGCGVSLNSGPDISLLPADYELNLLIADPEQAEQVLDTFTDHHWPIIASHSISLRWHSVTGKTLAKRYADKLNQRGLSRDQIHLSQRLEPLENNADLQISTSAYIVISPICQPTTVGKLNWQANVGCFTEGLRWKSMTSPEKAVSEK
ncbi:hypothetical protein [Ferrimonas pelagia]|uniref:Uncharacterized protein n=1 Tax=Ferrimonas pelagia TaxID=1177826 RepID=A0ABP9FGR7_9GAMM